MKIDTSTINGFDEMSAEEKIEALQNFEFEDDSIKLKTLLAKANSEASDYKKQLREKQSEEERMKAEREESDKALRNELEMLRKEKTISSLKSQYLELGYDGELAEKSANAMADGDTDSVFAYQKSFLENQKKMFEKESLANQPDITAGEQGKAQSSEIDKLRRYAGL